MTADATNPILTSCLEESLVAVGMTQSGRKGVTRHAHS